MKILPSPIFFFKFLYFWEWKWGLVWARSRNTPLIQNHLCVLTVGSQVTVKRTPWDYFINTLSHISGLSYTSRSSCVWLNLSVAEFTWWRLSPRFIYTQWSGSSISTHGLPEVVMHQSFPLQPLFEWMVQRFRKHAYWLSYTEVYYNPYSCMRFSIVDKTGLAVSFYFQSLC